MRAPIALLLLGYAAWAFAADDVKVLDEVELQARAAKPVVVVPPKYPEEAARARVEGTVDVHGLVLSDGNFDVKRLEGEREDFKAAVKDVIELWRFVPSYGEDCSPRPVEAQLRVWFEMKGDRPSISISRGTVTSKPPLLPGAVQTLKAVKRVDPNYPEKAVRAGRAGTVEALMLVGEEGDVKRVEIIPSTTPSIFGDAVFRALGAWKFEPRPAGKSVCALYTVVFSLR